MSLVIEATVFNPKMVGKPCKLEGHTVDGDHFNCYALISEVKGDSIEVLHHSGKRSAFSLEDLDCGEDSLEITILEVEEID